MITGDVTVAGIVVSIMALFSCAGQRPSNLGVAEDRLRPLLQVPELRVCNHLVTDFATADGLLA